MAKQGKRKIIDAAFYLFLRHGYKGVSLEDIKAVTRLSKGAIYYHFDSKYAIYLAAVEEYFFKLLEVDFSNEGKISFPERLRNRFTYFADFIDFVETLGPEGIPFPIRSFFIFQLESEQDIHILERVQQSMERYRQEIGYLVLSAIEEGEMESTLSATVIAQQLMSMVEGIAIHHSSVEKNCKELLLKKYEEVIAPYLALLMEKKAPVTHN